MTKSYCWNSLGELQSPIAVTYKENMTKSYEWNSLGELQSSITVTLKDNDKVLLL